MGEQTPQQKATPDPAEENGTPRKEQTPAPEEQDRIQIVGLHGDDPIVSYQGQVYSCHWASTIGTDLFFARAPLPEDRDARIAEPLRRLNGSFELIGASSARLVAKQARLRPKWNQKRVEQAQPGSSHSFARIQDAESVETIKFPVPEHATRAQKRQANFLEQLSAVKARLGEKDKVKPTAYTSRGSNMRPGEDDGTQGQRVFVTSPTPERVGDFTFITEDGSNPPSPRSQRSPRQSPRRTSTKMNPPPNKRARRAGGRRGSTARRRAGRAQPTESSLRNEQVGEAGPNTESATPATWDELNQMDTT
ncbi:Transcription factor TFIIIC tau55-related protein [Macrophomina phaseolina MS6]|uniref:Transcription factor TFIIIC tau55-related protein n=2 Tax=Macrophomina phaseolina TaxID=35725 RepID=K2S531_MACPH|nr:Transcription factor TFIIIC tau55-related protein [Macrophomina phaseolina MS6]